MATDFTAEGNLKFLDLKRVYGHIFTGLTKRWNSYSLHAVNRAEGVVLDVSYFPVSGLPYVHEERIRFSEVEKIEDAGDRLIARMKEFNKEWDDVFFGDMWGVNAHRIKDIENSRGFNEVKDFDVDDLLAHESIVLPGRPFVFSMHKKGDVYQGHARGNNKKAKAVTSLLRDIGLVVGMK
jgi:hypothetical protein